jgi:hypothetical protein
MSQKLRSHLTYANVMATIAVFIALATGGAYASHLVVNSSDVVNESLLSEDVKGNVGTATTAAVNGTLTGADISGQQARPPVGQRFVDGSLTTYDIKNFSLGNGDFLTGSVDTRVATDGSLTGADIKSFSLEGGDLATGAVTTSTLADTAVNSEKVADGSLTGVDLANGAVNSAKVADDSLHSGDIGDEQLTGVDIREGTLVGVTDRCPRDERLLRTADLCVFSRGNGSWAAASRDCPAFDARLPTFGEALHIALESDVPWVGEPGAARWFWTDEFTSSQAVYGVDEEGNFGEFGPTTNLLAVVCVSPSTDQPLGEPIPASR